MSNHTTIAGAPAAPVHHAVAADSPAAACCGGAPQQDAYPASPDAPLATRRLGSYAELRSGGDMNPIPAAEPPIDLEAAYAQTRRSLLSYLRRLSGDAQIAEDLMHDVMVKALATLRDRGETPRNLSAWLHRVAHNAAMDYHRAMKPELPFDDDVAESLAADTPAADELAEQTAMDAISQCLRPIAERLPDTYRDVVRAAEFDHRMLQDIAEELGISVAAARQRASRGRRLLRDDLEQCCRQLVAHAGLTPQEREPKVESDAAQPGETPRRSCGCAGQTTCR